MLETHLSSSITRQRLRTGAAAEYIDAFADWLHLNGYKPTSIDNGLTSLAAWTDWMLTAGFTAHDLLPGFEACKLVIEQRAADSLQPRPQSAIDHGRLVIHSIPPTAGRASAACEPGHPLLNTWPILGEFRSWMRAHRGLTETTLDVYQGILVGLLDAVGDDTRAYSPEGLRAFVLDRARPHGIERAKSIVVAVRAFMRFLGATGRCPAGMEYALPGFASWRISSVPRFLATEDVERVVDSCTGHLFELRDRAVLLLLARLALRASEVAQLKFSDIDWHNGEISVCGKGRRQESLPLPQEVGNAILLYVNEGRPSLHVPEVFTTVLAPFHPINTCGCYPHRTCGAASGQD